MQSTDYTTWTTEELKKRLVELIDFADELVETREATVESDERLTRTYERMRRVVSELADRGTI